MTIQIKRDALASEIRRYRKAARAAGLKRSKGIVRLRVVVRSFQRIKRPCNA